MRKRMTAVFVLSLLLFAPFLWSGVCFAASPPSDKDIIKAIDASGSMKSADGKFAVIPPTTVTQIGKRNKDGSWPVKVTFHLTHKLEDGRMSPPTETTTSFRIFRAKDDSGKPVWKAKLGS
jgi:hypothetical protein